MLHAPRHRRFTCIAWLALLLALMQPALARATYLHALHRAAHSHGPVPTSAPSVPADTVRNDCASTRSDPAHGHHEAAAIGAIPASPLFSPGDNAHGDCDCRRCPVLTSHALACAESPWLPAAPLAVSPDVSAAVLPRVHRPHPCGLGSRGPPDAA